MKRSRCHLAGAVLALLTTSPLPAHAAAYANARFGYSISYPNDLLIPEHEADNSDGRSFHARHGAAKMSVWGNFRNDQAPDAISREYQADCVGGKITYKAIRPRLVAFSCVTSAGNVIYQKTLIGEDDILRSVRFDYPYPERATWDPVVKQVSGSLRVEPGAY